MFCATIIESKTIVIHAQSIFVSSGGLVFAGPKDL